MSYYKEMDAGKKRYIKWFSGLGFFYLLSLPLVVIVAGLADDWNRNKTVFVTEALCTVTTYCLLVLFLRPGSSFAFQKMEVIEQVDDHDEDGPNLELAALPQDDMDQTETKSHPMGKV